MFGPAGRIEKVIRRRGYVKVRVEIYGFLPGTAWLEIEGEEGLINELENLLGMQGIARRDISMREALGLLRSVESFFISEADKWYDHETSLEIRGRRGIAKVSGHSSILNRLRQRLNELLGPLDAFK